MKILIVEDDNMIREGLSEYLSEFGYTVIQAKDGREALSEFNSDINLFILEIIKDTRSTKLINITT